MDFFYAAFQGCQCTRITTRTKQNEQLLPGLFSISGHSGKASLKNPHRLIKFALKKTKEIQRRGFRCFLMIFVVFSWFSVGRVVLYTASVGFPLLKALVETLLTNLAKIGGRGRLMTGGEGYPNTGHDQFAISSAHDVSSGTSGCFIRPFTGL